MNGRESLIHALRILVLALSDARTESERDRSYVACVSALDELEREFNRLEATQGLPSDLAALLRDPTIILQRDHEVRLADGRTLAEHLIEWQNAPSNTASADLRDE